MKKFFPKKSLLVLTLLALPSIVLGQEFVPLTNLPGLEQAASAPTLPTFLNNLYKLCIGAAAVIAVIQIMRAGAYFMFNKGSITQNQQAKSLITNSILGLLLVLSPAIVFSIINPDILDLKLDVSKLELGDVGGQNPSPTETGYLLQYYYTRENTSTGYTCYVTSSRIHPTQQACQTAKSQLPNVLAAPEADEERSEMVFVKSCVLTSQDSGSFTPDINVPACPQSISF